MKKTISIIYILLITLLLAGCSTNSGENKSVVRFNIGAEPDSLDPLKSAATDTEALFHNVFEGLLIFNERGELLPGLASSYEVSNDGLVYTFTLRENVKFHNGQDFTSEDVLYTYNKLTGLNNEEAMSSKYSNVEKLEAKDPYTFVITLKEASASFLPLCIFPILPKDYQDQEVKPIGTGPYKFVSYIPGQKIEFEINKDYYDLDRMGKVERVEVYIMTDESAIVAALQAKNLNLANISADDADLLKDKFTIYSSPQNMVQLMALNNEKAPFNDIRVRQAINYAIDKDQIIEGVFSGYATRLESNFSPLMDLYFNRDIKNTYITDLDKAKALLKEADLEEGFEMVIKVPSNYQKHIDTAQFIVQQLEKINISVKIESVEWATWLDEVYSKANYEATIIGLTGKLDPNDILGRYESIYPKNFFKFSNEEYDKLVKEGMVELDEAKRIQIYKRMQEILVEEAVAVYISDPNLVIASDPALKGYTFYPLGFYDFTKLYFE